MSLRVFKTVATGAAAIAATYIVDAGQARRLTDVHVHFNIAPAVAGNLTVTIDSGVAAAYDTLLQTASMVGLTDYLWIPAEEVWLGPADAIDVVYANADTRTYGVTITMSGEA